MPEKQESQEQKSAHLPAGLAAPARRALLGAGLTRLEHLAGLREADVLQLHGMGPQAMQVIRAALIDRGLSFADTAVHQ